MEEDSWLPGIRDGRDRSDTWQVGDNMREPRGDGTALNPDCSGCYPSKCVTKLSTTIQAHKHTHTHTHTHICAYVWTEPMSKFWFWYCILAVQKVTIRENWVKGTQGLPVHFEVTSYQSINISKQKFKTKHKIFPI